MKSKRRSKFDYKFSRQVGLWYWNSRTNVVSDSINWITKYSLNKLHRRWYYNSIESINQLDTHKMIRIKHLIILDKGYILQWIDMLQYIFWKRVSQYCPKRHVLQVSIVLIIVIYCIILPHTVQLQNGYGRCFKMSYSRCSSFGAWIYAHQRV